MHMSNSLVSPGVGAAMIILTGGIAAYSAVKSKDEIDKKKVLLMASSGSLVFAMQMINFQIPGTGSSGHIGGGILLAMLLGPYLGYLSMTSILTVQCLFFADGGILALGNNIFNLGVFPCFVVYPIIKRFLSKREFNFKSIIWISMAGVVLSLSLGAFSVTIETLISGITQIKFSEFCMLMLPIHVAIGVGEGIITAVILVAIYKMCPLVLTSSLNREKVNIDMKKLGLSLCISGFVVAGGLSYFASECPDGLEWSIINITGEEEVKASGAIYETLDNIQEATAFMPDYSFEENTGLLGTSLSGIVGLGITMFVISLIGMALCRRNKEYFEIE